MDNERNLGIVQNTMYFPTSLGNVGKLKLNNLIPPR